MRVTREKLNRWGEPEDSEPVLHIDEWFPSERTHQSEGMANFSRAFVPVGIILGLVLGGISVALIAHAFRGETVTVSAALVGGALGSWALTFLIPYGTLVYYGIKKQVLIGRRNRGEAIDMTPEDIDEYTVPLRNVPGVARLMMGELTSGNKATPLGMRRARVLTIAAAAGYFVAVVVAVWVSR